MPEYIVNVGGHRYTVHASAPHVAVSGILKSIGTRKTHGFAGEKGWEIRKETREVRAPLKLAVGESVAVVVERVA